MSLGDKRIVEVDEGDEHMTFDVAILVNAESCVKGMQTELYDSGVSYHMSPYHDHFEDYVQITPLINTTFRLLEKGTYK